MYQEASTVPSLKDRALVAQKNADIRKRKQALLADVGRLHPLIKKGKAVTKQIVAGRQDRVRLRRSRDSPRMWDGHMAYGVGSINQHNDWCE